MTTFRRAFALAALAGLLACAGPPPPAPNPIEAHLDAGRFEDAAREAENAVRRSPDDPALRVLAARAHLGTGNLDRAVAQLEMAHQLAPGDPEISILLGEIEQERENVADAYVAFRRATRLAPDDIRGWAGLALTAEALGFESEAVDAYERWAELEREQGLVP